MIKRFGSFLACAFVALFAAVLGVAFQRYNPQPLSLEALNSAQLARNIAQAHGFSTDVLGISQLPTLASKPNAPDLLHAPFFPFLLGWVFTFAGETDKVVVGLTLALYALSAVLLFVLSKRILQRGGLAAVIAVAFAISLPVLATATSGQSQALTTCLVLLLLLILTPKPEYFNSLEQPLPLDGPVLLENGELVVPGQQAAVSNAASADGVEDLHSNLTPSRSETAKLTAAKLAPAQMALVQAALEQEAAAQHPELQPIVPVPDNGEIDIFAPPPQPPDRRLLSYFGIGALAALCYLSDYVSVFYMLPLLVFWGEGIVGWRWRRIALFVLGFLLIATPWWVRNVRLIGNPFYSLQWVVLSGQLPGVSLLESQLKAQVIQLFYGASNSPHLYLMPFIVLSFWIRFQTQMISRSKPAIWLALLLGLLSFSVFDPGNPLGLVPLAAPLIFLGFATFFQIVGNAAFYEAILDRLVPSLDFEPDLGDPTTFHATVKNDAVHPLWTRIKLRLLALFRLPLRVHVSPEAEVLYGGRFPFARIVETQSIALLFLVLCLPVLWQFTQPPRPALPDYKAALQPLTKVTGPSQVVVTDVPQLVTWYSDRKTTILPERLSEIDTLKNQPSIGTFYLSGQPLSKGYSEWAALSGPINISGYQRVTGPESRTMVYVRGPSIEDAQRLAQKQPSRASAHLALGQALLQRGRFQEAFAAFKTAQRLQPNSSDATVGAGSALAALGRLPQAQAQLSRALQLTPRSIPAMMGLAQVLGAQGKTNQAITLYERVLSDSPNYPVALNNLAQLYADQNQNLYRALELARRAAAQNPGNSSILDTAGSVCLRLGYRDEAARYFQAALKLSPNNEGYKNRLRQAQGTA